MATDAATGEWDRDGTSIITIFNNLVFLITRSHIVDRLLLKTQLPFMNTAQRLHFLLKSIVFQSWTVIESRRIHLPSRKLGELVFHFGMMVMQQIQDCCVNMVLGYRAITCHGLFPRLEQFMLLTGCFSNQNQQAVLL